MVYNYYAKYKWVFFFFFMVFTLFVLAMFIGRILVL